MKSPLLEAIDLECIKGYSRLFHSINFVLEESQALHIKGNNGSGKTSLLRILSGLREPEFGTVRWKGIDIKTNRSVYLEKLVYQAHHDGLKKELTPMENLTFLNHIQPVCSISDIDHVLDRMNIQHIANFPCYQLSAGQRQRVKIARVILANAKLLILDEPGTALDQFGLQILEHFLIEHLENQGMIIFSSHHDFKLGWFRLLELTL